MSGVRSQLEGTDVKATMNFESGSTSHVVAGKRNTAKSLQALVNGLPVVDYTYVDAIDKAAAPEEPNVPESMSVLEQDFDAHWPDPALYLPAPSKEPGQVRPAELFAPDPKRLNIFEGFTFVFGDRKQFDALHPPIADGSGKAVLMPNKPGLTPASEFVSFMKEKAGESGMRSFRGDVGSKTVLLVLFSPKNHEQWANDVLEEACRTLGQDCVEQNEFLDAILMNNPAQLRRPSEHGGTNGSLQNGGMFHNEKFSISDLGSL